jgi:hypothetical protein
VQTFIDTRAIEERVRSEYLEMPGLCLTPAQASRLWALDHHTSEQILKELVSVGFLACTRRGAYLLASLG